MSVYEDAVKKRTEFIMYHPKNFMSYFKRHPVHNKLPLRKNIEQWVREDDAFSDEVARLGKVTKELIESEVITRTAKTIGEDMSSKNIAEKIINSCLKKAQDGMMTRDLLRTLRTEIDRALVDVASRNNVVIQAGNASFTGTNATMKLNISVKSQTGEVISREAEDFRNNAEAFGLNKEDFGKTFKYQGTNYKIIGLKPRSYKSPVIVESDRGKRYKMSVEMVKMNLHPNQPQQSTGLTDEIKRKFRLLANQLSPENLYADGERSKSEAMRLHAQIMREWRQLEQQAGIRVSEDDVWGWK